MNEVEELDVVSQNENVIETPAPAKPAKKRNDLPVGLSGNMAMNMMSKKEKKKVLDQRK